MRTLWTFLWLLCLPVWVHAAALADFTDRQAADGLRQTLLQSGTEAISSLGRADGFLGNPKVKIPLPDNLAKIESLLRTLGMGSKADELLVAMNRAAEGAVGQAKPLLVSAVKKMSIQDAKQILTGGDDAATQYLRRVTGDDLRQKFRPVVDKAVSKVGVAQRYNSLVDKAGGFGLKEQSIEDYVTDKFLDGLWLMVAEKEKALRQDPVGAASSLVRKLLGAVQ